MAHFYGSMSGSRGETTRMGTKGSGLQAHVRGWDVGVVAQMYHDERTGKDLVILTLTSGSNGRKQGKRIGTFSADDL